MINEKKTLIVVYKDELMLNQLKKLVETNDDGEGDDIVGTKDGSVQIVAWTEDVWKDQKKAGNITSKVLFLGNLDTTKDLLPVIDTKFEKFGVSYGWAGSQALIHIDESALEDENEYNKFFDEFSVMPVPSDFVKNKKLEKENEKMEQMALEHQRELENAMDEASSSDDEDMDLFQKAGVVAAEGASAIGSFFGMIGGAIASVAGSIFGSDDTLVKRQMMLYGIINLYLNDLQGFMNS